MKHNVARFNQTQDSEAKAPWKSLISEMLPGFLEHLKVELGRSPGTLVRYECHMKGFVGAVGDCPVMKIDDECLSLYKRRLMEAGLSPATRSSRIGCLRSFLRYLRDVKGLAVYDAEKVRRPKVPSRAVEFLTKEEVQRLLESIPARGLTGLRDRALAEVLCSTGMRISEVLSLDRKSIDWEAAEAVIVGKGGKQRKVYFSEHAIDWLHKYLERRWDVHPALFISQGLEPQRLGAHGSWKRFNRYAQLAGLSKRVYPHMLRHTMATTLLANGCPVGHIRVLLGHAHLATTCKYYLGVLSDREAKAAHGRYLSYEPDSVERPHEKGAGDENDLTDQTRSVN